MYYWTTQYDANFGSRIVDTTVLSPKIVGSESYPQLFLQGSGVIFDSRIEGEVVLYNARRFLVQFVPLRKGLFDFGAREQWP